MGTRRERVVLELQDDLSPGMIRAAAATKLLDRDLNSLSTANVKALAASRSSSREIDGITRSADKAGPAIDRLSGRVGILADLLLTLGPAALPIGALAVPAVTMLSAGLGAAVVAGGSAVLAFQGVGEALDALNKAQLDPTKDNLADAEEAMKRISPAAREMVEQLDSMGALFNMLRDAGAEELFPGLIDALDTITERGPEFERIVRAVNAELGDIASDAADSLASKRWDDFFRMVETRAPGALDGMADGLGNVVHGLSEIIEAFIPLNADGMDWLVDATEGFDDWATGLKKTEGFKDFVKYVRTNGPQVADTVGAVATAMIDVAEAAAPLGGPALSAIEAVAQAVSKIADSGFSTELLAGVAAMRAINRLAPGAAGALALMGGAAGAGGGKGKGGKGRRGAGGIGLAPWQIAAAYVAVDAATDAAGWEEATDRQIDKSQEFAEKWGATWTEQIEAARVKMSDLLEVSTGKGLFGLAENDTGLTDAILNAPVEKQIALRKQLHEQYGIGFRALEREGILLEGTTTHLDRQRGSVDALANDLRRLGGTKAEPVIDLKDGAAKLKRREADDWINKWGGRKEAAVLDMFDVTRRKKSKEADDWILNWGQERVEAEADVNARPAFDILSQLAGQMAALDGTVATTYVQTKRLPGGSPGLGPVDGFAAGSFVRTYGPSALPAELTHEGIAA